jgi:hypothetical protein
MAARDPRSIPDGLVITPGSAAGAVEYERLELMPMDLW